MLSIDERVVQKTRKESNVAWRAVLTLLPLLYMCYMCPPTAVYVSLSSCCLYKSACSTKTPMESMRVWRAALAAATHRCVWVWVWLWVWCGCGCMTATLIL